MESFNLGLGATLEDGHDRGEVTSLSSVWNELMTGRSKVADLFSSPLRFYATLMRAAPDGSPVAPDATLARRLTIFERVLLTGSQKQVAFEFDVSVSSVATASRLALSFMGLDTVPSKVPVLLVLAAHSAHAASPGLPARVIRFEGPGPIDRLVSVPRDDDPLTQQLSPGERDVLRALIDGKSHEQIASERGTSLRTVANQLGNAFRRLSASGRAGLLVQLAELRVASAG